MLEKLLNELPACIEVGGENLWLHLQPTLNREYWNAFYGSVTEDGGISIYHTEGKTPVQALEDMQGLLRVREMLQSS